MMLREARYPVVYPRHVVGSVVLEADWHKVRDERAGDSVLQSTLDVVPFSSVTTLVFIGTLTITYMTFASP